MAISQASNHDGSEHLSLVESACLRPKMYTLNGTYAELVCFLEGLFSGSHSPATSPDEEAWFRLGDRLNHDLFERAGGSGWQKGFSALRARSPDDEAALQDLASLYRGLLAEHA